MRDKCEASGLAVRVNADGRAMCPLCEDDWHAITKDGRIVAHSRLRNRHLSPGEVATRLAKATLLKPGAAE